MYGRADRRSVVGTIDITDADPSLEHADMFIRSMFDVTLGKPAGAGERGSKESDPG